MNITVAPISSENLKDFLYFFGEVAFKDNKDWSGCYCYFYHFAGNDEEWVKRTGEDNRLSAIKSIKEGLMNGYLAYLNGKPIGWCNVNDKSNYSRLLLNKELGDAEGKIASIVCFNIAPDYRKQGVASKLLNKICAVYSEKGYEYIEAYPRRDVLTSALHYHGPLSMYLKKGFIIYKNLTDYDVVRKKL